MTKSCFITISVKSAARDVAQALKDLCFLQSVNIPEAWSTPRKKERKKESAKKKIERHQVVMLSLTLDVATVNPWLQQPIQKSCSPRLGEPIAALNAGSHVCSAEMSDGSGGDHTCKWGRETIKCWRNDPQFNLYKEIDLLAWQLNSQIYSVLNASWDFYPYANLMIEGNLSCGFMSTF